MTTDIDLPVPPRPTAISQQTAVEQARAVAEVQAAVLVAQQIPRNLARAIDEMRQACQDMTLAQRAFYTVPKRGTGPSVHLARELARIWGNLDYGVRELRRDDEAGESEIQAFAWDQEKNTRPTRSFVVPHARMKDGKRQRLTDLGDIYLSNQNIGARAVRECIFSVLPLRFVEEAQDICRRTLENGGGEPLEDRVGRMVGGFEGIGVTVDQLEEKIGRKRARWTAQDVADMGILYTSITRDGIDRDGEFPPKVVSTAEIEAAAAQIEEQQTTVSEPAEEAPAGDVTLNTSSSLAKRMFAVLGDIGIRDKADRLRYVSSIVGRDIASSTDMTEDDAQKVITAAEADLAQMREAGQ